METLYIINKVTVHNMYSNFINNVSITILYMYYICMYVCVKETILRKSEYHQKVLKFKNTSQFPQNLFNESRFLNARTASLATISVSKKFHSEKNY